MADSVDSSGARRLDHVECENCGAYYHCHRCDCNTPELVWAAPVSPAAAPSLEPAITARPLEWDQDSYGQWTDRHHGFSVMREDGDELPYCAAWGENDAEQFATLELAQAWCQAQIDRYIAKYAVLNSSLRFWSWDAESWKPKDRRRNLVRAAALLLAEIERLDRRDVASRHAAAAPWLT